MFSQFISMEPCHIDPVYNDRIGIHLVMVSLCTFGTACLAWLLRWYLCKRFEHFRECDKLTQLYASKNIVKSGVLFMLIPPSLIILWNGIIHSIWERQLILICGVFVYSYRYEWRFTNTKTVACFYTGSPHLCSLV